MKQPRITVDWSRRFRIEDQNILLHVKNAEREPRITVGLPTFRRPQTLRRALASLVRQSFREYVVIVSDNDGTNQETIDTITEFAKDLPEIYLITQKSNIGALGNLGLLLGCATTDYFMWLADDDEVSADYMAELVPLLDADSTAVCAMGRWRAMRNPQEGEYRRQLENSAVSRFIRVFRYIALEADDSFFYGLHRPDLLRQCRFGGYFYPNSQILTNYCYVFLFDLIWRGPVRYSHQATWTCHNYSEKAYNHAQANGLSDKLKTLVRRLNVYFLYCQKIAVKDPLILLVAVPASFLGLTRDIVTAAGRAVLRKAGR